MSRTSKPTIRVDRGELCHQICRRIGHTRRRATSINLSKREMMLISSALELRDEEIMTLRRRVAALEQHLPQATKEIV